MGCYLTDPRRHDVYVFAGDTDLETGQLLGATGQILDGGSQFRSTADSVASRGSAFSRQTAGGVGGPESRPRTVRR